MPEIALSSLIVAEVAGWHDAKRPDRRERPRLGAAQVVRLLVDPAVRNVAKSRFRRWSMRLFRAMLPSSDSQAVLETLPAQFGSAEQIESAIEYKEIQMQLTGREQLLCAYKKLGLSSREIARAEGMTVVSVNTHFYRIKRKIRAMREFGADAGVAKTPQATKPRLA
jgi:DNA-binding CsgD family transcriptional regulator